MKRFVCLPLVFVYCDSRHLDGGGQISLPQVGDDNKMAACRHSREDLDVRVLEKWLLEAAGINTPQSPHFSCG